MRKMKLDEAKAECQRYLNYLQSQEDKSAALQRLAAERRAGKHTAAEAQRIIQQIQGAGLTVYDGGNLADAIRAILSHLTPHPSKK